MDRREALKRLGVGGALVVSAPLLLDSFNVAHAASGDPVVPDPPSGPEAVPMLPPTAKTNSVDIAFSEDAFDRDGQLWFYWSVLSAAPPITIEVNPNDSSNATVSKAQGNGKMNSFTIEVQVWEELGSNMTQIARYLVISDGGQLTVTPQPL
jgi:hypothetical protein